MILKFFAGDSWWLFSDIRTINHQFMPKEEMTPERVSELIASHGYYLSREHKVEQVDAWFHIMMCYRGGGSDDVLIEDTLKDQVFIMDDSGKTIDKL